MKTVKLKRGVICTGPTASSTSEVAQAAYGGHEHARYGGGCQLTAAGRFAGLAAAFQAGAARFAAQRAEGAATGGYRARSPPVARLRGEGGAADGLTCAGAGGGGAPAGALVRQAGGHGPAGRRRGRGRGGRGRGRARRLGRALPGAAAAAPPAARAAPRAPAAAPRAAARAAPARAPAAAAGTYFTIAYLMLRSRLSFLTVAAWRSKHSLTVQCQFDTVSRYDYKIMKKY